MVNIIETNRFKFFNVDENIVIFTYQDDLEKLNLNLDKIAKNTQNTWQPNRNQKEIDKNTIQGKIVEELFIDLIEYQNCQNDNMRQLSYTAYDQFRTDLFKKHAPFDGLIYEKNNPNIALVKQKITETILASHYGMLTDDTIEFCRANNVYLVEIKSSKIPNNIYLSESSNLLKYTSHQALINRLRQLDLFKYPKFNRKNGDIIHNTCDYLAWVKNNIISMSQKSDSEIIDAEINSSLDIYTRIFINDKVTTDDGKKVFIGYLLGYVLGYQFYENLKIMNFPSKKSSKAIYVTYPISNTTSFNRLFDDKRLW